MIAEARSEIAERRGRDGRKVFGQFVSTSIVTLAVVLMSSWYNYGQGCYCRGSDGMARSSTRRERRAPGTAPNVVLLETQTPRAVQVGSVGRLPASRVVRSAASQPDAGRSFPQVV